MLYELADEVNGLKFGALTAGFSLLRRLETVIEQTLPSDAHVRCSGPLHVSVTNLDDKKNLLVSKFESRHSLINVSFQWTDMACVDSKARVWVLLHKYF